MMSILVLLQSPMVEPLGVTVVAGDGCGTKKSHTRFASSNGSDAPIFPWFPALAFPLVRTQAWTKLWSSKFGKVTYQGAWTRRESKSRSFRSAPVKEGNPHAKPLDEDAAHFLVRMVRKYPHQVTIYAGGP